MIDKNTALAMLAGARAIEQNKRYCGTIFCHDAFGEQPGEISYYEAAAEKSKLRYTWEKARSAEAFDRKLTAYHVRQIKAQEAALCAYRKSHAGERGKVMQSFRRAGKAGLGEGGTHDI